MIFDYLTLLAEQLAEQAEVYGNFLQKASLSTKGSSELKNRSLKNNREGFVFMCKYWHFLKIDWKMPKLL